MDFCGTTLKRAAPLPRQKLKIPDQVILFLSFLNNFDIDQSSEIYSDFVTTGMRDGRVGGTDRRSSRQYRGDL